MDMTKFEHTDDPGFTALAGELRRWVRALGIPPSTEATGATEATISEIRLNTSDPSVQQGEP